MPNRLVVDLGNVKLTKKQLSVVEKSVQQAALGALAGIDTRGDFVARFPREWMGLWIDPARKLAARDLKTFNSTLLKVAKR